MANLTFGSLFAGIGGLDLGLERAGMTCKWQVEIDDYATRVLTKHWPNIPKYRDVREVGKHNLEPVDLICGGFPCQDISVAGNQAGINGARSGLWSEYHRILCELRPRFVLVENVARLLFHGMGRVLGDLASIGFDAEWRVFRASDFGAPHKRDRVFIFAYSAGIRRNFPNHPAPALSSRNGIPNLFKPEYRWQREDGGHSLERVGWTVEPAIRGSDDGVSTAMDQLRGLGNAVVPQVAEWIGKRIVESC